MNDSTRKLLVVEDDVGLQRQLKWRFETFEVMCAGNRAEAIAALKRFDPAVVLQDLGLPPDADGVSEGFATMAAIQEQAPHAKIIVVTGREGREHALRAVQLGAYDFCQKPVDAPLLAAIVDRAARLHELEIENKQLLEARGSSGLPGVIAFSDAMVKVCRTIEKLAPTDATVLLLGESGTGQERLASALHALSRRAAKPMIVINCAAIPENLLESELFGYERGAFTGAVKQTIGKVEQANGGTLFLDEIGDMPFQLQSKMLRFLQERVIERVGGRELIPVDVRIVAATNRNMEEAIASEKFRSDLYYRISEVSVNVPPLRDRDADSVLIAQYLLRAAAKKHGRGGLKLTEDALRAIQACKWPGNVRELENRVNRAAIMTDGKQVSAQDLGLQVPAAEEGGEELLRLRDVRQRAELQAVRRALSIAGGNVSRAAELLDIARPTLYDLMERAGLRASGERSEESGRETT
jgi:two-component system NtrC family response regulator